LEKILVIQTAFTGDVILATSVLEHLHKENQDAKISILIRKGNEELFTNHPFVETVYIWNKKERKYRHLFQLLLQIREKRFSKVINLQRFASTGFLTIFSGASERIGFSENPFSFLYTRRISYHQLLEKKVPELQRYGRLIGLETDDSVIQPRIYPFENCLPEGISEPFVVLAPGSVWRTKMLPEEKWKELCQKIPVGVQIVFIGSGKERDLCDAIIKNSGKESQSINLAGRLRLLQSAYVMSKARMNYTNDSAPMHLATAMSAPLTAFFCSTVPEFGFAPHYEGARIIETQDKLLCRPCGLHGKSSCPERHFRCGYGIAIPGTE
jgi:heptosyltransferase-2